MSATPSLTLLESIHKTHAYGWTFEAFDVFLTGQNSLDRTDLGRKLGLKSRGGWCFELNEWLALALEDAGFPLRRLMARSVVAPNRPRTHQISLVEVEGQVWTADAGFGAQTPRGVMKLEDGFERVHDGLPYRMEYRTSAPGLVGEPGHWVLRCRHHGQWGDLYRFTLESATPEDFAVGNHYHLSNPLSTFADVRMATRLIPGGRISLTDHTLKVWRNTSEGEELEKEEVIPDRSTWANTLAMRFGIQLTEAQIDRLWQLEPSVSRGSPPL